MIQVNKLVIFPFLFSIFPILLLYSENVNEIPVVELVTPILLTFLIVSLLFLVLNYILKSGIKAGLIITFLATIFFSYGYIFNMLQETPLLDLGFVHQRYVIIPFVIVLVSVIYYLIRIKTELTNFRSIFNVISVVMVFVMLFNIGTFYFENESDVDEFSKIDFEYELSKINLVNDSMVNKTLPDIYHIVLDEYTSDKVLLEDFQFDNSYFIDQLLDSDFIVPTTTFANYPVTEQFMRSTLNMNYLDNQDYNRFDTEKMISDNFVMKLLKQNGYAVIIPYSGYGPHDRFNDSDLNPCSDVLLLNSRFLTELSRTTIVNYFAEKQIENERRHIQLCALSELENIEQKYDKPVYVFAHLFIPHAPYLFDKDGNPVTPQSSKLKGLQGWQDVDGYLNEIQFINKRIINLVNTILSQQNESIIIIQGDTGSSILNDPSIDNHIKKRLSILYAIHVPYTDEKMNYDDISPVNTYRMVFNHYFKTNLEILDNQYYWNDDNQIKDITDMIN